VVVEVTAPPEPVPVTVTRYCPPLAWDVATSVNDVAWPAVTSGDEKEPETPGGKPDTAKAMVWLTPEVTVEPTASTVEDSVAIVMDEGEEREKRLGALTTRDTSLVVLSLLPVPVTTRG
jgi:hypothetical protein